MDSLQKSVLHWRHIHEVLKKNHGKKLKSTYGHCRLDVRANKQRFSIGSAACELCKERKDTGCGTCPVCRFTGDTGCIGTPYHDAYIEIHRQDTVTDSVIQLVKKEVEFLEALMSRDQKKELALEESIKSWSARVRLLKKHMGVTITHAVLQDELGSYFCVMNHRVHYGGKACALCTQYFNDDCRGCPVQEKTGSTDCHGSGYHRLLKIIHGSKFVNTTLTKAMESEVKFLKSLRKKPVKVHVTTTALKSRIKELEDTVKQLKTNLGDNKVILENCIRSRKEKDEMISALINEKSELEAKLQRIRDTL